MTRTDAMLGVHMAGAHATDLVAEGVLALHLGAAVADVAAAVHAHPTLAEAMGEAALACPSNPRPNVAEQRKRTATKFRRTT